MMPRTLGILMLFMPLALTAYSQPTINSGTSAGISATDLPQRNVQIEVRQLQREDKQRAGVQVRTPSGSIQGSSIASHGQLQVEQRQSRQSNNTTQYALVLNGRSTRVNLGSSTPLRLMQTYVRNGALFITQGTVMLEAHTGFVATPRWHGGDRVELEISAQQSGRTGALQTSNTSSTLLLPVGEWVTVAQSEQDSSSSTSGLGGIGNQTRSGGSDVQVRLTLK
jgi:hypothetical protein